MSEINLKVFSNADAGTSSGTTMTTSRASGASSSSVVEAMPSQSTCQTASDQRMTLRSTGTRLIYVALLANLAVPGMTGPITLRILSICSYRVVARVLGDDGRLNDDRSSDWSRLSP